MLGGVAQKNVLISFCTHRCINVQNQSYFAQKSVSISEENPNFSEGAFPVKQA